MLHRPMWEQSMSGLEPAATRLPAGLADDRPGIWISYVPAEHVETDIRALVLVLDHRCVALPELPYESAKIGAGPPPCACRKAGCSFTMGSRVRSCPASTRPAGSLVYRAGAMLLDPSDPSRVIDRTPEPLMEPETVEEQVGTVPNVVFPTAIADDRGPRLRVLRHGGCQHRRGGAPRTGGERSRRCCTSCRPARVRGFGTFLADAIAEMPDRRAGRRRRHAAGRRWRRRSPPPAAIETSLDGLLADRDLDIVAIATPPWTHASLAVRAIEAASRAGREAAGHRRRRMPPGRRGGFCDLAESSRSIMCCASRPSSRCSTDCWQSRSPADRVSARSGASRSRTTPPTRVCR